MTLSLSVKTLLCQRRAGLWARSSPPILSKMDWSEKHPSIPPWGLTRDQSPSWFNCSLSLPEKRHSLSLHPPPTPSSSLLHSSHSPLHFSTPHYHSPFQATARFYKNLPAPLNGTEHPYHTSLSIYSMPFTLIIFCIQGCDHANFLLCNTYCKTFHWLRCPCPSFSLSFYKTPDLYFTHVASSCFVSYLTVKAPAGQLCFSFICFTLCVSFPWNLLQCIVFLFVAFKLY